MRLRAACRWGALVAVATLGCGRHASNGSLDAAAAASATISHPSTSGDRDAPAARESLLLDMLAPSPRCRVEHGGAFLDVGSPEVVWATPGNPDIASAMPSYEREGATWGRVVDRAQSLTFAVEATGHVRGPVRIQMRARGRTLHKVTATLDGKPIGTLTFSSTDDRVATASNPLLFLDAGVHVLGLRWIGTAKKDDPLAEVDWIRVGVVDDETSTFAAPTRADTIAQVAVGGIPRRAFTLVAPSIVRCLVRVPDGASLVADAAVVGGAEAGESQGAIEARQYASGAAVGDARTVPVPNLDARRWTSLVIPLTPSRTLLGGGAVSSDLSIVEIAVTQASKRTRVAIAEPRIVVAARAPELPADASTKPIRRAIVIVLAGLDIAHTGLPSLEKLAREGVVFRGQRSPSAFAPASFASLLTGLPVPVHAVEDFGARLSQRTPTLAKLVAPLGVESSLFTEVPTSGPAFGFAHDFGHYEARSPLEGPPIAFDEIGKLLAQTDPQRALVIVDTRGAHPPWEVAPDALAKMAPDGYSGPIDPRHVVAVLAKTRRGLLHFSENDRVRMEGLIDAALAAQDRRLDTLIETLRSKSMLDDTLLIVTSDAPFVPPAITALPSPAPSTAPSAATTKRPTISVLSHDDQTRIPLFVRFPGGFGAGHVVAAVTDPTDVTATIVAAFGGSVGDLAGRDLRALSLDDTFALDTPRLEDDGRTFELLYGDLSMVGVWGRLPSLHVPGIPDDARNARPFEYVVAWGLAADARARWIDARAKGPGREAATIDEATQTAMDGWEKGAVSSK